MDRAEAVFLCVLAICFTLIVSLVVSCTETNFALSDYRECLDNAVYQSIDKCDIILKYGEIHHVK